MKQAYLLFLFFISFAMWSQAQSPQKFKFQAVARDAAGIPYQSANLGVRVSLIADGVSGTIDYSERHQVTTSPLGVFDLEIGGGIAIFGEMEMIDWGAHPYYLKIDIDPEGGTSYLNLGTSQLLSVPYAIYAKESGNSTGGDPTDELQNLIYDPATQTLSLSDGNTIQLQIPTIDMDEQTLSLSGTNLSIENGNSVDLSGLQDGVEDADADPTNEIQFLSLIGNTLFLSGSSQVNLPEDQDAQTLNFNPNTNELSISGGNSITIPSGGTDADADPNNELQDLSFNGTTLSISNGSSVDLSSLQDGTQDADANPNNELQSLSKTGNLVTLSNGGGSFVDEVNDLDANPQNEIQTLSIIGNNLQLSNGGGSINLPENTDNQSLNFNPITNELSISGGNAVIIPTGNTDADADPMNEIQTLSKTGSIVSLSNNGGSFTDEINDADSDPNNELQSISFNTNTNELSISNGNSVLIPTGGTDADADPTNELQSISKSGNTVALSNGGGSFIDEVEDADADPNNEIQTISLSGTNLSISNGSTIDLSVLQDGVTDADANPMNELQSISFNTSTNELSISNGNSVIIPTGGTDADADPNNELQTISKSGNIVTLSNGGGSFIDSVNDADADSSNELQDISLNGTNLSLSNASTIDLSILQDGTQDADADPSNELQDISLNGTNLSLSNASTIDLSILQDGTQDADADPSNELQDISLNGTNLSLSNASTIDLSVLQDGTQDADADPSNELQDISLNGTNLSLSNASTIDLSVLQDGTQDADADPNNELQNISKSGNTVTLSNSGGSFIDAVNDADADPTNEIETWSTLAGIPSDIADGDQVNDADADPSNELQSISKSGSTVTLSNGGGSFTDAVNDADSNPTNELQNLSLSGNTLTLSGGGSVDLSNVGEGSPWVNFGNHINYSQDVGIGFLNTPEAALHVSGATFSGTYDLGQTNNGNQWRIGQASLGEKMIFSTKASGSSFYTRQLVFTNDGHVAIGDNLDPDEELVIGDNFDSGWAIPAITVGNNSGGAIELGTTSSKIAISSSSTFNRTRIVASNLDGVGLGRIEVRTSSLTVGTNPGTSDASLEVEHGDRGLYLRHEDNPNNHWEIYTSANPSNADLFLYRNDAQRGRFDDVSGAYTAISDARLKTNVRSIGTILPTVLQLNPSRYQFKEDEKERDYIGFLAQEVEQLFPALVHKTSAEREGNPEYTLDYSGFGILAIKAIQEQQETIDEQAKKIEDLEKRLAKLEALLQPSRF